MILPTIRSRCWILNFGPLSLEKVKNYLYRKFPNLSSDLLEKVLQSFNGDNLSELIEILFQIKNNETEEVEFEQEIEFINLFRLNYKNQFHEIITLIDQYGLLNDRQKSKIALIKFQDYCQQLYYIMSNNLYDDASNISRLAKALDPYKFIEVIQFLPEFYRLIDGYVNLNLLWLKLFILINKSFKK